MEDDSQTSRHDDSQTLQRGKAPCKVSQGEELAGKSLGCHLPKQDERPGRCRRKRWPADPRPGSPLESLQYSELGAMRVPTTGKPAQETDTGAPIRTSPEDAACTSPPPAPHHPPQLGTGGGSSSCFSSTQSVLANGMRFSEGWWPLQLLAT